MIEEGGRFDRACTAYLATSLAVDLYRQKKHTIDEIVSVWS